MGPNNSGHFKKGFTPWNKGKILGAQSPELIAKRFRGRTNFKHSDETKAKMRAIKLDRLSRLGYINTPEIRAKISSTLTGRKNPAHSLRMRGRSGPSSPRWINDRTQLKTDRRHAYDTRYREWMFKVKTRDGWKCKIADTNCSGRMEAHHILTWRDFPELRYQINNGITLCQHHHPRTRVGEMQMVTAFQELVANAQ